MISPTAVRMVFRKKPTLCAYIHTLGPQSHCLHFNSVREVYALKPVARRENYPLEICLTGDGVTDFSPRQTINLSNGRRRHRFFTETKNPVQTVSAKHCREQTAKSRAESFRISDYNVYNMCMTSPIPNLVLSCMLMYSHSKGEH